MPMFGGMYQGPQNWGDRLAIIGAALKDASPNSQGGNLSAAQQMLMQRQMFQRQQEMLQEPGMFGGQAPQGTAAQAPAMISPGSGPTMKGPGDDGNPIGPAETPPIYAPPQQGPAPQAASGPDYIKMAKMAAAGMLPGTPADYLKLAQPHLMVTPSGDAINDKDASLAGRVFPSTEKNQIVLRDARGNPTGVINLPGAAKAAGETAGSVAGAQEQAKAGWDLVDVPMSDGSTVKLPRAVAAPILASRFAAQGGSAQAGGPTATAAPASVPGAGPGGASQFGVSQTPAAAELAKARAATQGKNETDISGARSAMQQVDDQTNMIAQNLHDMLGETQDPNTGKWVKRKPSMITGLSTGSATDFIEHVPLLNQQAKDLAGKIETVRNGTSFNSLQAIKNAMAAAGDGGTGSIRMTDQTARMLGEINGSLNQDQSGPQFEATIRRHLAQLDTLNRDRHALFDSQYQGIRQTTPGQTTPTANYNKPSAPSAQSSPRVPQPGAVVKGYKFLGGNPASPQSWARVR